MTDQLVLGVSLKDEATFENFYIGQNKIVVHEITKTARNQGEHIIYFCGSGGQGCTHLLQAACHEAKLHHFTSVYLPMSHYADFSPSVFEGLENIHLICIDDLQYIAGKPEWEEAFFHLYNRVRDASTNLIVAANVLPKFLGLVLPDVVSRLNWGSVFQLHALSDEEKLKTLIMRAELRGMTLLEEVGKYILNHCPRHMTTLFTTLDALDKASLAAQKKLTIPFVKTILQI